MLGIEDKWVSAAYVLCLASTVLCVIYGLITWNKGDEGAEQVAEDVQWAEHEKKVEEEL